MPVRLDAERWATRPGCRTVLTVVHTVTTGQRLLDTIRLLEGDLRVQVVFTMAPDVFSNGVPEFLAGLRGVVVPWEQAVETRFDLALAAGYEGIHQLHAPVVVLPHGAGYNKVVVDGHRPRAAQDSGAYGLSRQWLIRDSAVVPAAIALSHREELVRLGHACPEATSVASVVGDFRYDRIRASMPLRAVYRVALGAKTSQRLVVVTSTWGPKSLLARNSELLERLVAELPRDEYRVALLLHPNAWNAHGEWQIRAWLARLRRAGLALVTQHADWCGVLVAADHIIGDHGSMTLYGTVAGASVLLATYPDTGVDPGSPMAELGSLAPRLNLDRPLARQLAGNSRTQRHDDFARVAARISSEPGRFARNMRTLMYRKLRLRAPRQHFPEVEPADPPVLVQAQIEESAAS
ncbi:hypothetical protein [Peterkaempfera bronchialis]|uniref:hypothetical protein n=1 Tax=Peterkaempfera bronchialis TaxID=2126346 RepID=UPI0013B4370D|nr:hypothetical protein [Peterkaempfera bronchialis]